jgi:PAS domain S-box-containing protein
MTTPTILCVDDERNVLLSLRAQLSRYFPDYAIEIAESATEALKLVEELLAEGAEIPLVIADQIMAGLRGDEFLIELHHRHPQILQVMLTGQARAEDVGNVVNRGNLYRFISKPWDEADLCLTVREALRRYQQEQQLTQQQMALEQANQELTVLNTDLEQQVEERTQQLQVALDFNQQIIATAQEGIIVWDRDLRYQVWNHFMEELSGLPVDAVLGQYCLDLFPFLQENGVFDLLQRALAGEALCAPDTYFNVPETRRRGWSSECFVPLRDAQGNITGVLGTVHDISDRKQAEAQATTNLAEALQWQQRYAAAGRASQQLLYDYDVKTNQTRRMGDPESIGYSIAELGQGGAEFWASLIHPDDRPCFEAAVQQALTNQQPFQDLEYRICTKENRYIWVEDTNTILLDEAGNPSQIIGYVTNIDHRKQIEVALRESETRLRRLTENVPGMVYRYGRHADGTHSFLYVSPRCLDIYGVPPEVVIENADQLFNLFHPDDTPAVQAAIAASVADPEQIFFVEHRIITPDGQVKWIQATTSLPEHQPNGDIVWDGVAIDITARKQAEVALQESQQFIQQVADSSPNVIYIYDLAQQRNVYVNREVTVFLGYTHEEVMERVDQSLATLMHPDDLEPAMRHFERLAALPDGAIADFEYRMQHKNGEWRWFSSRDTVFKRDGDGRVTQLLGNAQDITPRKLAEEELRANEQKYHQILDAITDMILVKGPESQIAWASKQPPPGRAVALNDGL